ncbi:MAG TPA: EamA family transporter [Dermatophilaceae bacterium]|nr:EamA family transporter [Dermatophilaceae bacterium]
MTRIPATALVVVAVVSVQFGGALAVTLLPLVGVAGSVTLRLLVAAVLLMAVLRPRLRGRSRGDWLVVAGFGACLAAMNLCFYGSLVYLPVGVAVTVEFIGPLTLAAVLSRRPADLVAVVGAAAGVALISGALRLDVQALRPAGLALALAAGGMWAAYILLSARTGARFAGLDGLAVAMCVGTLLVAPFGLLGAGAGLWAPQALARGAGVAMLSSVVPYSLELVALRRLAAHVFGILLSLEPAFAALAGWLVLGQVLNSWQLTGMALVVLASLAVSGRRREPAETG